MSKTVARTGWRDVLKATVCAGTAVLFFGCGTYVPEGATVVTVKNSKHEYDRADLRPPENELAKSRIIRMKWYDTNTFLTTATLSPGIYSFRARNYDGAAMVRDITVVPDKDLYEITVETVDADKVDNTDEAQEGPEVKGRLLLSGQARKSVREVSVLFVGKEVILRSSAVDNNGAFSVKAPQSGNWKIEVHTLGDAPKSYYHPLAKVSGPVDLGVIALK